MRTDYRKIPAEMRPPNNLLVANYTVRIFSPDVTRFMEKSLFPQSFTFKKEVTLVTEAPEIDSFEKSPEVVIGVPGMDAGECCVY